MPIVVTDGTGEYALAELVAEFETAVPAHGYVVVDGLLVDRVVAAGMIPGQPRLVRPLSGLLGSGLFMTFAHLTDTMDVVVYEGEPEPDEGAFADARDTTMRRIVEFASMFGPLGVPVEHVGDSTGEPLDDWLGESQALRDAVGSWETLSGAGTRPDRVRQLYLDRVPTGRVDWWDESGARWSGWDALRKQFERVDVRRRLGRVALAPAADRPLALRVVTDSLLGALWVQFAQAIDGDREFRACRTCRRYFHLDPATARSDRKFCSDACRSGAYRARKQERD